MNAQKNLTKLQAEQSKIKNSVLENLNVDLDKNIANMQDFTKNNVEFNNLKKNMNDAKNAYDKALRNTRRARTAVVGGVAGVGATAYGMNKAKKNKESNQLQYIYY